MAVPQGPFAYIVGVKWGGDNFFVTGASSSVIVSQTGETLTWDNLGPWGGAGEASGRIYAGAFHKKNREFFLIGDNFTEGDGGPQLIKSRDGRTWEAVLSRSQMTNLFGDGEEGDTLSTWIGYSEEEKKLLAWAVMSKPPTRNYYVSLNSSSDGMSWTKDEFDYGPTALLVPPSLPRKGTIIDPDDEEQEARIPIWVRDKKPFLAIASTVSNPEYHKYAFMDRPGRLEVSFDKGVSWRETGVGMPQTESGQGVGVTDFACGKDVIVAGGAGGLKTSRDGITWQSTYPQYSSPGSFGDTWRIGFASGKFVALALDPSDNFVWGHISEDGFAWTRLAADSDFFGSSTPPNFITTGRVPLS